MAYPQFHITSKLNWKWWGVLLLFTCGLLGFLSGVEVSDRSGLPESNVFTKIYYSFGLFVLGGLDLGTPSDGPLYGKVLLWTAYFGAPILTASAVIESLLMALQPHSWRLRKIKDHIIIGGSNELAVSFLKKIREENKNTPILVISGESDKARLEELESYGNISIVVSVGDYRSIIRRLGMERARAILLLSDQDVLNCEFATLLVERAPALASKITLHISDLRFLSVLQRTNIGRLCNAFNSYEVAASHLAAQMLIEQFEATQYRDTVVLAGFGRFGQSILEQLELHATGKFSTVAIIDIDATRKTLISDELTGKDKAYVRHVIEGDIDHPAVWEKLFKEVVIVNEAPVFILSTGCDEHNMGAAIGLRKHYADALIISRSLFPSVFAKQVCSEHNIVSITMTELMEEAIPSRWYLGDSS